MFIDSIAVILLPVLLALALWLLLLSGLLITQRIFIKRIILEDPVEMKLSGVFYGLANTMLICLSMTFAVCLIAGALAVPFIMHFYSSYAETIFDRDGATHARTRRAVGTARAARTINVPNDHRTIQEALSAASSGDTVIVQDGTYTGVGNRNLDFKGRAVTLRSENGPENCIIDCESEGRGFFFRSGETSKSVLDGFTVMNAYVSGPNFQGFGGGIFCMADSSPTIVNCIITNNRADNGAGISCWRSAPTISNCSFVGNSASNEGGAIHCSKSSPVITHCIIDDNSSSGHSGGIHCTNSSSPTIFNCAVTNCTSEKNGGGIYSWHSSPDISGCTISGNTAAAEGGGVAFYSSSPAIRNSIIWGNSAPIGSELMLGFNSSASVAHTNISFATPSVHVAPDCVLTPGSGIIDANPLFVSGSEGDYYLSQIGSGQANNSPCLDAGSGTAADFGLDSYTTRTDQVADSGTVDMGYHH